VTVTDVKANIRPDCFAFPKTTRPGTQKAQEQSRATKTHNKIAANPCKSPKSSHHLTSKSGAVFNGKTKDHHFNPISLNNKHACKQYAPI
jgi:hypothetical protein